MTRLISISLLIVGLFFLQQGIFRYQLWESNSPGSGFVPVLAGVLLAVFSLVIFIKNDKQTTTLSKKHFYPILGCLLLLGLIQVIGMIISIAIFMVVWLFMVEKFPFSRAFIHGIATTAVIYVVFKVILNVPLPEGFLGI